MKQETRPERPDDDYELNGYTRPERYFAAMFDHLFALMAVLCFATIVVEYSPKWENIGPRVILGCAVPLIYFVYYFLFEYAISTTPGKLFFSLYVQHFDGSRCTARAALLRTVTRFLEVNPILLGGLPAFFVIRFSVRKQRWGDILANTIVTDQKPVATQVAE